MDLPQTNTPASSKATTQASAPPSRQSSGGINDASDDLLNLIRAVRLMWKNRKWVAIGAGAVTLLGIIYALTATPVYVSEATIAPKDVSSNMGTAQLMMSQMGDAGSMLAGEMGMGGTTLNRIAVIAQSHDLAEAVIARYNLLPLLFHKKYDFKNNCWKIKDPKKIPTIIQGAQNLKKGILSVSLDIKKNIITFKAGLYDPALAAKVLSYYLEELDNKMRSDIIREANSRKAYLDAQMKSTADPWVMQKLQAMVGMEMEKSMVVADRSFDVLESPMVPLKKSKPKRATIGIIFLFLGFCLSGGAVLGMDYYNKAKGKYKEVWGE